MGTCIICGTPVDGEICASHEEDAVFEFTGTSPSQLTPGRFYRGTVDGYADFGVFVDVGDHVTGLLHRSELDRRLESLDWEPGDEVYVQVLDVRDNGNVDLGWSIRQRERDFRGKLIDAPDGERRPEETDDEAEAEARAEAEADAESEPGSQTDAGAGTDADAGTDSRAAESEAASDDALDAEPPESSADSTRNGAAPTDGGSVSEPALGTEPTEPALNRTTVDALREQVGSVVRLEGEITGIRQTSGPTVFELRDETGTVECAAFVEAGVRAYPAVEVDDVVALEGEVETRHGDLQVETEVLSVLEGEEREAIVDRHEAAIRREATPDRVELLAEHEPIAALEDDLVAAVATIRRALMEARPVVVRHGATADGYVAGAAIERAVLPEIRAKHTREDAEYHYFERRPLEGRVYDMDAATDDVTSMLQARDRHGEQLPLVVLVGVGSTVESADGYDLLEHYGAERVVIDGGLADPEIADSVSVALSPSIAGADDATVTSSALAANVAAHVNEDVREDLEHLPAISYWEDTPEAYVDLAAEAGFDDRAVSERREAIALEAYYQSYKDKRELVADVLFDGGAGLASHVSEQFRDKLETELATARENLTVRGVGDVTVSVLDTDAYTHRYDFPPTELLLDALHRKERGRTDGPAVTVGLDEDELHVRATDPLDVRDLGAAVAEAVPEGGVHVVGGRAGHVAFLVGERDAVLEAAIEALGDALEA